MECLSLMIMYPELNFPKINLKLNTKDNVWWVWDELRRCEVKLTPEEWVRQHGLHYLIYYKNYPKGLMQAEKKITLNHLSKRFDLLVYNKLGKPFLLAEFKQTEVDITQETFYQISRYNLIIKAPYLWISNGLKHFFYFVDFNSNEIKPINEIPQYD